MPVTHPGSTFTAPAMRAAALGALALLWLALLAPAAGAAEELTHAILLRVIDGDTIEVLAGGTVDRVRLLRVNTPEVGAKGAAEATAELVRIITARPPEAASGLTRLARNRWARPELDRAVAGRPLQLQYETPGRPERDRYGRRLAYVWAGPTLVNAALIQGGWTRYWTRYGRGRHATQLQAAEDAARKAKRGLWACNCFR